MKDEELIKQFEIPTKYARTNCTINEVQLKDLLKCISKRGDIYEDKN